MKQILFLIYDLERGGPELRIVDLARTLGGRVGIHVISMSKNVALMDELVQYGAHVTIKELNKPWLEWATVQDICAYVQKNQIEIINVFDLKGLIAAYFPLIGLSRNNKSSRILYHCVNEIKIEGLQGRSLVRMINKCNTILCNSFFSARQVETKGVPSDRLRVVHNGVDTDQFLQQRALGDAVRLKYDIPLSSFVIGTVANFRPQKNYLFLITAFAQLLKKLPAARLLCVGGGPGLDECRALATEIGVLGNIIFTGYASNILSCLNAMDLFVLCSEWEGLPNAVMQAMACELTVVVTRVGGCPELIENTYEGFLFEPNEMETFISLVQNLAEQPKLRAVVGSRARERIVRDFSLSQMVKGYEKLFLSC